MEGGIGGDVSTWKSNHKGPNVNEWRVWVRLSDTPPLRRVPAFRPTSEPTKMPEHQRMLCKQYKVTERKNSEDIATTVIETMTH